LNLIRRVVGGVVPSSQREQLALIVLTDNSEDVNSKTALVALQRLAAQ
jgi:hypothetical protein